MDVNSKSICWFLPAYNEADNIRKMVESCVNFFERKACDYSILLVIDGSSDETPLLAKLLADENEHVFAIFHDVNKGYGAALRTGFQAALQTNHSLIGFCDSDNQFDIQDLEEMLEVIDNCDTVLGYRVRRADGLKRLLLGRTWHYLTGLICKFNAKDVDCGFKLFKRHVIETVTPKLSGKFAAISPEIIARIQHAKFKVQEYPVKHLPRSEGEQSGSSLKVIIGSIKDLFSIRHALSSEV